MLQSQKPPEAVEAERSVLGAILLTNCFSEVSEILTPDCFYSTDHRQIYEAMTRLAASGRPTDVLSVKEECGVDPYYISTLTNHVVNNELIGNHCRIIVERFVKRELIRVGIEIANEGYSGGDAFGMIDSLESSLLKIRGLTQKKNYKSIETILVEFVQDLEQIRHRDEHLTGVTSGFRELDNVTCGWQPTDLIIIAARPSVGKTAFMLNLACNAGVPVGVFSLEMSDRQLIQRAVSAESGMFMWDIKNGRVNDEQMKELFEKGVRPMSKKKMFVDPTPAIKLSELRSKARRMVERDGVKIIFIDYLQLMRPDVVNKGRKDLDVGDITSGLKAMAKELEVPVIALSQLSRGVEARSDNEPRLSDLRESGAIEQDADMVMFLWRPSERELAENMSLNGVINVKIEKHRNGTLETFLGQFNKDIQKFESLKVLDKRTFEPIGETWRPYKED